MSPLAAICGVFYIFYISQLGNGGGTYANVIHSRAELSSSACNAFHPDLANNDVNEQSTQLDVI